MPRTCEWGIPHAARSTSLVYHEAMRSTNPAGRERSRPGHGLSSSGAPMLELQRLVVEIGEMAR